MTANDAPLAVTMGDPSGIGPEIIAKMYLRRPEHRRWIVIGDPRVMKHATSMLGADVSVHSISNIADAVFDSGALNVLASSHLVDLPSVGQVSAVAGQAAFDAVITAIRLARDGLVRGIVSTRRVQ